MKKLSTLTLTVMIALATMAATPTVMADPGWEHANWNNAPAAVCVGLKKKIVFGKSVLEWLGINQGQCVSFATQIIHGP